MSEMQLLKVKAVSERLDVSEKTVRKLIKSGDLPSVFIGRSLRVPAYAVDSMIVKSGATPDPAEYLDRLSPDPAERELLFKIAPGPTLTKGW